MEAASLNYISFSDEIPTTRRDEITGLWVKTVQAKGKKKPLKTSLSFIDSLLYFLDRYSMQ